MLDGAAVEAPSVNVMYGARSRVVTEIRRRIPPTSPIAWLMGSERAPHAWQGIRQLIAYAAEALDDRIFENAIARHRPVIAVLYPERLLELTADERARSSALRASHRSHYTHSWASWQPLVQAAAAVAVDLLVAATAIVVVPELATLDVLTRFALLEVFRARRGSLRGLYVGHDPVREREPELLWGVEADGGMAQIRSQLCDYQVGPGVQVTWLRELGEPAIVPIVAVNDWSAAAPDSVALRVLQETPLPTRDQLEACVSAMRWAAEAYAFEQVFRIGTLLEPHRGALGWEAQADHAALTAVAATNVHFVDTVTPGFDEPLFAMYQRAVALCTEPVAAASLSIRQAFAVVDRRGVDADACLAHASARLHQIEGADSVSYCRAWLAIASAWHELHREDVVAADRHARAAWAALDDVAARATRERSTPRGAALQREVSCIRFMIAGHCAMHCAGVDDALASWWFVRAEQLRTMVPMLLSFEVFHWVLLPQRDDDRRILYERCCRGIRDAEACWDARARYLYGAIAADCAYRLGRLGDAAGHLQTLLSHGSFGNPGAVMTGDLRPFALRVFLRAGWYTAVLDAADGWLADPTAADRAEAHAMTAWALALRGDRPASSLALELAIDAAVAQGDHRGMLRVAVIAVQAVMQWNDDSEVKRALAIAWELAEEAPGTFCEAVPPADCLRLCMLQWRSEPESAVLWRACRLLPSCLGDSESWWDVSELLAAIAGWHQGGGTLSAEIRSGLSIVYRLAPDRADWQVALSGLS